MGVGGLVVIGGRLFGCSSEILQVARDQGVVRLSRAKRQPHGAGYGSNERT